VLGVHCGTAGFLELIRQGSKQLPVIGIVNCCRHYPLSLPLSQILLIGPIKELSQQGITGKL